MPSLEIRAEYRQSQALSPRLQHAVRLLQMSSLDFAATVRETLGRNPFLEAEDEADDAAGAPPPGEWPLTASAAAEAFAGTPDADAILPEAHEFDTGHDRDFWVGDGSALRPADDGELSALETMAAETPLNVHLHRQLDLLPLSGRDLALARCIVESLDDDGYLRASMEELLAVAALDPAPTLQELQIALNHVQALEPAGVAARSVAECLRLQLPAIECPDLRALASAIVDRHLPLLARHDAAGLARKLAVSPARAEQVCDRIRRLDPRPGWRVGSTGVAHIVPDVVVKKVRGRWNVQLNPAVVPRLRLNQVYANLFQRHRSPANAEMGAHLQEARWTLRNVEQRFSTILDVAEAIVERQSSFLDYGAMAMKPLVLREIADAVGIHESTVCRVTNNKYIATPSGVFELKHFFSRAMISANGSACSGTAIRGLIGDIIEAEHDDEPLSDAEITRRLVEQGLTVARRTVTKYRQMLRIEAVDRRRRHARG